MISIYSGLPGSGKSYSAVKYVLLPALSQGRTVVTNLAINIDYIKKLYPDADVHQIPFCAASESACEHFNLDNYPSGSVYIIDECARIFPTGWKANQVPASLMSFFTEHRHYLDANGRSTDIAVIAQCSSQLAKWVRDVTEATYRHVKLDRLGKAGSFKVEIYNGAQSAAKPLTRDRLRYWTVKYDAAIYAFYRSHTKTDGVVDVDESATDERSKYAIGYKKWILFFILSILLAMFLGYKFYNGFFPGDPVKPEPQVVNNPADTQVRQAPEPERHLAYRYIHGDITPSRASDDALVLMHLSPKYKVVGEVVGSSIKLLVASELMTFTIPASLHCKRSFTLDDWVCSLDGSTFITSQSGPDFSAHEFASDRLPDDIAQLDHVVSQNIDFE